MQLSLRIQKIVDMVSDCQCVADVGCDHGYVAISIIQRGLAKRAICTDVNEGPIQRATSNINSAGLSDQISTRLSDGLAHISPGEADSIVIAGMGGLLMVDILQNGIECVRSAKQLVLSPQSDLDKFREYMANSNLMILDEAMLFEEGKYYTIIKCKFSDAIYKLSRAELKYGPKLIERKDAVLKEYLHKERNNLQNLIKELDAKGIKGRLEEVVSELELNEEVLKLYEM